MTFLWIFSYFFSFILFPKNNEELLKSRLILRSVLRMLNSSLVISHMTSVLRNRWTL